MIFHWLNEVRNIARIFAKLSEKFCGRFIIYNAFVIDCISMFDNLVETVRSLPMCTDTWQGRY